MIYQQQLSSPIKTSPTTNTGVLLVQPAPYDKEWGANRQYIGLLKIGAYHEHVGDTVEYIISPQIPKRVTNPKRVYVSSMFTYWYKPVWDAVRIYKTMFPAAKVMLGGIYATLCPEHAKKSGADEVCVGEHSLAKTFPPNPLLLPYKTDFAYCMTSYGCSGNCKFCATHKLYGIGIRQRPVNDVVSEITLQHTRGFRKIYFGDDDLLFRADKHFIPIMRRVKHLGMRYYVYGGLQSRWVTKEIAQIFKTHKFEMLSFGFESVSSDVLKKMNRGGLGGVTALDNALTLLKRAKFKLENVMVFFMIGLPYQTEDDMYNTLGYIVKKGVWAQPQRWSPIPGTDDFNMLDADIKNMDLEDLHYKKFVDKHHNDDTLKKIYRAARYFNCALRYSNVNMFDTEYKPIYDKIFEGGS